MFTDQDAHNSEDKPEPDHDASDDEDDARLTSNVKTANEMPLPKKKHDDEEEAKAKAQRSPRRKKGEKAREEEASTEPLNTAERLEHLHLMQEKKFINFPCNSGLSGQVFTTGELLVCNDAEKETAFVDEVDNQPKVRNVRNFMIGPVYGEDKKLPVGVIQFINKTNEQQIDDADRQRFNDLADLIGMCIENTNAIHTTIGVTLMFNTRMEKIQNYVNEHRKHNEDKPTLDVLQEIGKHMKECQNYYERLSIARKDAP